MVDKPVRTRFAPSPTGSIHIGGMRQALFSWLYARRHGGQFILRIEDTDQERFIEGSLNLIYEAFDWFDLDIDEGPRQGGEFGSYVQSERLELYQQWANWLLENGHAYKAFETPQELAQIREEREKMGKAGYDGRARNLTTDEIAQFEAEGRKPVLRFKMPREGKTRTSDMIRGITEFDNSQLNDPVILKSDGFPTYHLAHVIDDHFMEISHITRGVEWLPSLPLHWNIFEAFGWEKPIFAHLPLIMDDKGQKLSKRKTIEGGKSDVPVIVHDFIDAGYLPEAVTNFITNIGWNFGDNQEIFSREEAMKRFDLTDINKANAAYPIEKLESINQYYIQAMETSKLANLLKPVFEDAGYTVDIALMEQVVPIINTRLKKLKEAPNIAGFLFADWAKFEAPPAEWMIHKKSTAAESVTILQRVIELIESLEDFSPTAQYDAFKALAGEMGISNSVLFTPLRISVTGQRVHPPIFETLEILGKDEAIRRIKLAIDQLQKIVSN
ncbi:MAG: glutamate--tRNA ligase [Anaerolineae bacterium]|nr:glutamate--tRNA ligase [Anaerolineae bacterium]